MKIIDGQMIACGSCSWLFAGRHRIVKGCRHCRTGGRRGPDRGSFQVRTVMVMEALPEYAGDLCFVIAFFIVGRIDPGMSVTQGCIFCCCSSGWVVGFISAIYQGKVSAAGIQMLQSTRRHWEVRLRWH